MTLLTDFLFFYYGVRECRAFHRQKPLSHFIVDFFCSELMLAIEVDGVSHDGMNKKDEARQKRLEDSGVRFLRFTDDEIATSTEETLQKIEKWIDENVVKRTSR